MAVNTVKVAILVSRSLLWISLQLASERQGSFVLNLHQDLVDQGSQRSETHEFSRGDLECLSSHCSPVLAIFYPYPALRPPIFLAFSAFLLGPATHLLHSCIWLPCTAHLT